MQNPMATMLNDHEFIVASESPICTHENKTKPGIQKYNLHQNEWNEIITYSDSFKIVNPRLVSDIKTNKLYLFGNEYINSGKSEIVTIDMKTKKVLTKRTEIKTIHMGATNVNGIIHLIGGDKNSEHVTWNADNDETKQIHDFAAEFKEMFGACFVYVPSKGVILLIGGFDRGYAGDQAAVGIWRFDIKLNKWENVIKGEDFTFYNVSATLSSNENYVIIGGGYSNYMPSDKMFVFNIKDETDYKLNKCGIQCPSGGLHNIVRTGGIKDELLVIGWIKELFKTLEFKELALPPMYILQLIVVRYNEEEIHWVARAMKNVNVDTTHYAIKLKHVLSALM